MEIKTLKDIINPCTRDLAEGGHPPSCDCLWYAIRKEAIKNIRDAEKNRKVNGEEFTNGRIFELKHFCDIEEEDLN